MTSIDPSKYESVVVEKAAEPTLNDTGTSETILYDASHGSNLVIYSMWHIEIHDRTIFIFNKISVTTQDKIKF